MTPAGHYSEYKNSGTDWLGDIPAHWEMVKLKNGFDLQKRPAVKSAGIVTAFRDGQVTLRSNRRIDGYTEGDKQIGYQTIHPGDLVIHAMDAFAGAIGVSDSFGQSTPVYSVCTPKSGFNAYFYARALRHIALTGYITSLAKGVRERSTDFRWADAKELPVPRPPIEEQNKIVAFLDRETAQIDELIGKQERLIELLAEKRQAIITHAVTKGLDPTAPTEPTGIPWLGHIDASWQIRPLKAAGNINLGKMIQPNAKTETDFEAPYLRAANVQPDGVLALDDVKRMWFNEGELQSLSLRAGDVVVVEGGIGGFGRAAYVDRDLPGLGYQNSINRIRPNNSVDGRFLTYLLLTARHFGYIHAYCTGVSMPHLTAEKLAAIRVPLPDGVTQTKISDHLDSQLATLNTLADKAGAVIGILQERRSVLISAAVSGKIEVGSS